MQQHGMIKGTSPDRFPTGMLKEGLRSGYARLVCVCVCVCERERERAGGGERGNH